MSADNNFIHLDEFHAWVTNVCDHGIVGYEYEPDGSVVAYDGGRDHVYHLLEIIYPPEETELSALWYHLEVKSRYGDFHKKVELEKNSE